MLRDWSRGAGSFQGFDLKSQQNEVRYGAMRVFMRGLTVILLLGLLAGAVYERVGRKRDQEALPRVGQAVDVGGRSLNIYCSGSGSPSVILDTGGSAPGFSNMPLQKLIDGRHQNRRSRDHHSSLLCEAQSADIPGIHNLPTSSLEVPARYSGHAGRWRYIGSRSALASPIEILRMLVGNHSKNPVAVQCLAHVSPPLLV